MYKYAVLFLMCVLSAFAARGDLPNADNKLSITRGTLTLSVSADGAISLFDKLSGQTFSQLKSPCEIKNISEFGGALCFDVCAPNLILKAKLFFVSDTSFELRLSGSGVMKNAFAYPPAWQNIAGDIGIYPLGTGYAFPVDMKDMPLPKSIPLCSGVHWSMALTGFERGGVFLVSGVEKPFDARVLNVSSDGIMQTQIEWLSQKGEFGYDRAIRFFVGRKLSAVMAQYRDWRASMGYIKTLKEKAKTTPALAKLEGAANFWIWDENDLNELYGRPKDPSAPARDIRRISSEMLALGITDVLWNYLSENRETCEYLKSLGFLVGRYDIYRDVLPADIAHKIIPVRVKRSVNTKYWPEIVRIEADGSRSKAWQVHGLDGNLYYQNGVCDICALWLTKKNVPEDLAKVPYSSRLIDVQAGTALNECYSKEHPAAREKSAEYIRLQNEYLASLGLVVGVECGQEIHARSYHFAEGLLNPTEFRIPEAGRRQNACLKLSEMPDNTLKYLLNPEYRIPLWELVYHDCVVNYPYWGSSACCCPEIMQKQDAFSILCGYPQLYSLDVRHWETLKEQIAASYKRCSPVAKKVGFERMTDFDYLTKDKKVQKTTFGNGVSVIVNFSDSGFRLPDGRDVPAWGYVIDEKK